MLCWRRVKPIEATSELPIGFWSRLRVAATNARACRLLAMLFQEDSDSESDSSDSSEEARMASATAAASLPTHAVPSSQPGHGPLSFMGCMREASPPPRFEETSTTTTTIQHHNNHHHHHNHHHRPPVGLPIGADFAHISAAGHHAFDSIPKAYLHQLYFDARGARKSFARVSYYYNGRACAVSRDREGAKISHRIHVKSQKLVKIRKPKKRRFHPLRGLRRIFRKKSRGAADAGSSSGGSGGRPSSSSAERGDPSANGGGGDHHLMSLIVRDREEVTLRDPSGRASDEIRSRSASELLTESSCSDRDRMFLRRRGMEESFSQLLQKGGAVVGQLSVSHDSVFPGEGSGQRARPLSSSLEMHASLEVLEQIKTVIENRNQVAVAGSTATATTTTSATSTTTATTTPEGFNSLHVSVLTIPALRAISTFQLSSVRYDLELYSVHI
ncbi:unnamed protein product [Trichogramma brassicae]|uniref:Uncharacterized protein n=1 Tax=Trichogramma brassicae TaxID=86971 RepID=A0A6H5I2N1_9HYME|nr:unnamed protein product [Trichogramma brassicae]